MSKKTKKKKHNKKLPSSSSEEGEKAPQEDVTKRRKSANRMQSDSRVDRCREKPENWGSPTIKDVAQNCRQIKKAVYRLSKTSASDERSGEKEERDVATTSASMLCNRDRSTQAAADIPGKGTIVTAGKTVEMRPSKPSSSHSGDAIPHRTEKTSRYDFQYSSQSSPKLTKTLTSPTSAELKEQRGILVKRRCRPSKPPKTGNHSKTSKPSDTSSLAKELRREKGKLGVRMCWRDRADDLKTKTGLFAGVKSSSRAAPDKTTEQSHTLAKHSTPDKRSKYFKHRTPKQAKLPCTQTTKADGKHMHDKDKGTQVVEELHLARSDRRLQVKLVQSYGELTCMDIDPTDDADTLSKQPVQQNLILVLDTNILLSHLEDVKKIRSHGLGALGFPLVLIPWVVLQELDSLKNRKGLSGSVASLASPAVQYIHRCLKNQEPRFWGQSMQQASQINYGLNAENSDDRVLQCCLQYQRLYPESALILCTNDKNLCSKALISGVKALSKVDLMEEGRRCTQPQTQAQCCDRRSGLCLGHVEKDKPLNKKQVNEGGEEEEEKRRDLSTCVSLLEDCLKEVLSEVLEVEMKDVYEDLWKEIVYLKPPWTLQDVLQCLKKHWIAVFGNIIPRTWLKTVLNLNDFFTSGKTVECSTTLKALHEAKALLGAFRSRSNYGGRVPSAISSLDNIIHRLLTQPERTKEASPNSDAVMSDVEEQQPSPSRVSHQEVWTLFENIWSKVFQTSSAVFTALRFDPGTVPSAQPEGGPPPPQDALDYLHRLSPMITQLLHVFSRVLPSDSGLEETQALLNFIHSNEIVTMETRFTAKDLLDCFSQQDYREKLKVGEAQLTELKVTLERCVEVMGQRITHTT